MTGSWKIFGAAALVVAVALALVVALLVPPLTDQAAAHRAEELVGEAELLAGVVRPLLTIEDPGRADAEMAERIRVLSSRVPDRRFTIVANDGRVLADSHEDASRMDNHADRDELVAAREGGRREPVLRRSDTLELDMLYYAVQVRDGLGAEAPLLGFARVALPAEDLHEQAALVRDAVLRAAAIALLAGAGAAALFARGVQKPVTEIAAFVGAIARGQPAARLPRSGRGDLARLTVAVNDMADQLDQRIGRIQRDATEIRTILASMVEGVLATDTEGRVLLVNNAAAEMLGTTGSQATGSKIWELARLPELDVLLTRCMATGRPDHVELSRPGPAADQVLHLTAGPLADENGLWGCVVVIHDLTEIRRLERVRRDFVVNVSHELKTPLTSMRGFLETVVSEPTMSEATRQRFLSRAQENTERLVAIVSDLLTLARVEAEDGRLEPQALDLRDVATECRDQASGLAATRGVSLRVDVPDRPVMVDADRTAVYTAVMNLLDNAVKYSPEAGSVRLAVSSDGDEARIDVEDRGPGIPAHETERIFERFYRIDKDRSRALGGTGLGLSIVRNVAHAHGGRVTVQSEVGRGSVFSLHLPLAGTGTAPSPAGRSDPA
ncbi:MAG: ATP-binding protein [Planctomycetota bacterium]|jgi:two-component system phosphate regulon sensor histidine kinase PhoR